MKIKILIHFVFCYLLMTTYYISFAGGGADRTVTLTDGIVIHTTDPNPQLASYSFAQIVAHHSQPDVAQHGVTVTSAGIFCANGNNYEIIPPAKPSPPVQPVSPPSTWTSVPSYSAPPPVSPPPPAPAPVLSSSTSYGGSCSSYISGYQPNWSDCSIQGTWDPNGFIKCQQINTWSPVYSSCGQLVTTNSYSDGVLVGSSSSCDASGCGPNATQPAPESVINTFSIGLSGTTNTVYSNSYANAKDKNFVNVRLVGNTNANKPVVGWGSEGNLKNFSDASSIASDRIGNQGKALIFDNYSKTLASVNPNDVILQVPVASVTPFIGRGDIEFFAGSTKLFLKDVSYSFKKPFVGKIFTWNFQKKDWSGQTSVGTTQKYLFKLLPTSTLNIASSISSYTLNDFTSGVSPFGDNLTVSGFEIVSKSLNNVLGVEFSGIINTGLEKKLNKAPGIQVSTAQVSYVLEGQPVKYLVSEDDAGDSTLSIKNIGGDIQGVQVLGQSQLQGKIEVTQQSINFTTIEKQSQRELIRKAAYEKIKFLASGQIVNRIKFVEGDVTISGKILDYETLIVKNGNVIIEGDIQGGTNGLGIIVLRDNYSVLSNNSLGNVYVAPNVKTIEAYIYADGGLMSVDSNKKPYLKDSLTRTQDLSNQLILKGTLFTRNTVGGALLAGGQYLLPGNYKTSDFNLSLMYDLNFLRRSNNGCDKNGNSSCKDLGEYEQVFVIIPNKSTTGNVPVLFK